MSVLLFPKIYLVFAVAGVKHNGISHKQMVEPANTLLEPGFYFHCKNLTFYAKLKIFRFQTTIGDISYFDKLII